METKPYRIQSPEDIAKDYGGNKQKIAQAMQLGVVDPTAGVLAGMFIDRMRSAQMQEMAPKPSVAQQVMGGAPSAPPLAGGLGATLPAAPPMAPDMGMAPPMEAPMPEEAPMGMAAGGMFEAPYMKDGGLSELPIPDGMFDENRDGGYAGGGIIAFNPGGKVDSEDIEVTAREEPESIYGNYRDPELNLTEVIQKIYKPERKYSGRMNELYEKALSPEEQKKRRKQDMWTSLAELGFGMASSKSPTLLGAIGEAGMRSAPAMAERAKERRAEQRDAIKTLAQQEGLNNKDALEVANIALGMTGKYADLRDKQLTREQQRVLAELEQIGANYRAQLAASSGIRSSEIAAGALTGTERILMRAAKDKKFKTLLENLGIYGGKTSTGTGTGAGEFVVTQESQ